MAGKIILFNIIFLIGIFLFPKTIYAASWYVDNTASGSNNGSSWANAWKSFSSISWTSIKGGDTLYISGGSSSKTYNETLSIGANGASGNYVKIDVGANSSSSSGHNGTVIIDGGGTRNKGIDISGHSYVQINGLSGNTYKLRIQNVAGTSNNSAASVFVGSGSYVNVDYLDINNSRSYGVKFNNMDHLRIRGCDIQTGVEAVNIFTDGIYGMIVTNSIFENNVVIEGNSADSALHVDAMQLFGPGAVEWGGENLIIRNNYFEFINGRGNVNAQTFITEDIGGYMYFYNNVIIGSSYTHYQAALFKDVWPGGGGHSAGVVYVWNNTIVSQYPSGGLALNMGNLTDANVGAIKNNILVVPNSGTGISKTFANADYNCYYGCSARGGTHNVVANPQYNPANQYRLNSNSSCINAGTSISSYFTTDRDGVTRPVGTAWDIGAYEYGGTVVTSPSPSVSPLSSPSPSLRPSASPSVSRLPSPSSSAAVLSGLAWEAEAGIINSPFIANGGFVYQTATSSLPADGGRAGYRFNLELPGYYLFKADVIGDTISSNSFWVNIDNEPAANSQIWDIFQLTGTTAEERAISWRGASAAETPQINPLSLYLSKGSHELIIRGREANAKLDTVKVVYDFKSLINCWQANSGLNNSLDYNQDGKVNALDAGPVFATGAF